MYASLEPATARIVRCNQTPARATGYTKEVIVGRSTFEMHHPDCRKDAKRSLERFMTAGEVQNQELHLLRKDGSRISMVCRL